VAVNAGAPIRNLAAGGGKALRLAAAAARAARAMRRARPRVGAGGAALTFSMPRSLRRAAASVALAAPLTLAQPSARAFAAPLVASNDTARVPARKAAPSVSPAPIVINYAPNLAINADHEADAAAVRRRVMNVLERHGRELHKVLARELVRRQRRDF
jgi:hypothetical protein